MKVGNKVEVVRRAIALNQPDPKDGLDVLSKLDHVAVREFFGAFFDLPLPTWSAYMRADASPAEVSRVMTQLFRSAPWSIRRRLVRGNPAGLARLARPS